MYAVIETLIISHSDFLLYVKVLCFEAVFSCSREAEPCNFYTLPCHEELVTHKLEKAEMLEEFVRILTEN